MRQTRHASPQRRLVAVMVHSSWLLAIPPGCTAPVGVVRSAGGGSSTDCPRIMLRHNQRYTLGGAQVTHSGVDFSVCSGEQVISVADGVVESVRTMDEIWQQENRSAWSRWSSVPTADPPTGGDVIIRHQTKNGGRFFAYQHLVNVRVVAGTRVQRGEPCGETAPWLCNVGLEEAPPSIAPDPCPELTAGQDACIVWCAEHAKASRVLACVYERCKGFDSAFDCPQRPGGIQL
jgi:hypothetical protein